MKTDCENVLDTHQAKLATMRALSLKMAESRRQLKDDLSQLRGLALHTNRHLQGLIARIDDHLSTSLGPLTLYRLYLLNTRGHVLCNKKTLFREDIHARNDADAIRCGWLWLDGAGQPDAHGFEVWRGRRLVSTGDRLSGAEGLMTSEVDVYCGGRRAASL